MIASVLGTVYQCHPVSAFWNPALGHHCFDTAAFWLANAIYNMTTDLIIVLSALPIIKDLGLPRYQTIGLMVVFSMGLVTFVTSVLRVTTLPGSAASKDQTSGTFISTIWTVAEASIALITVCCPMVRPIFKKLWPSVFHTEADSLPPRSQRGHPAPAAAAADQSPVHGLRPSSSQQPLTQSAAPPGHNETCEMHALTKAGVRVYRVQTSLE